MKTNTNLLTDDQMQDFIYTGMCSVKPSLPDSAHEDIHENLTDWFAENENPGNDILERVPRLKAIFEDPAVHGALTSILGPRYLIHRHRHCHNHLPGAKAQDNHKDYPAGGNVRDHHPRLVLILYYPQAVTSEMGPTAVQPGSQYYMSPQSDLEEITLCCESGTLVITHYDIWHRATENRSTDTRYMVKLLGVRTQEPTAPTWHNTSPHWTRPGEQVIQHEDISQHIWRWYRGASAVLPPGSGERAPDYDKRALVSEFEANERQRVNGYYRMCTYGKKVLSDLKEAMIAEAELKWETNPATGEYRNPSQLDVPFGLAAMGDPAVDLLVEQLTHPKAWARSAAAVTLGVMGASAYRATGTLGDTLKDENEWVRRNAAEALGNIGAQAEEAIPPLLAALEDRRSVTRWSLSEDGFRENVMMALLKIIPDEKKTAYPVFKTLDEDPSEYVRSWAKHLVNGIEQIV
jgi:hypothetical protein